MEARLPGQAGQVAVGGSRAVSLSPCGHGSVLTISAPPNFRARWGHSPTSRRPLMYMDLRRVAEWGSLVGDL